MPDDATHILINALSATAPGGFTVARNLAIHLGAARPAWRFTLALIDGVPMHDQWRPEDLPANVELLRAPAAEALRRVQRARYESGALAALARDRGVSLVLQLNGIPPRGMDRPTFCHNQDPWPYRPQA